MSTVGAFNKKNPTIKRILKEASELANSPSTDYHAEPLESDLFEWHFTLRGPPAPSHYAGGIYHGRISLPPTYPLRPPSFKFTTPTGRFEVNREICLSISGHHEETWQPAWGIRTALVAIRSFMDTDAKGQVGGIDTDKSVKERLATESVTFKCGICGKTNGEIMKEKDESVKAMGAVESGIKDEAVPDELRLAYREDLAKEDAGKSEDNATTAAPLDSASAPAQGQPHTSSQIAQVPPQTQQITNRSTTAPLAPQVTAQPAPEVPLWMDKAIYGVAVALVFMIVRQFA